MIFVDTSAIYALADVADPNHTIAVERFSRLVRERETLILHNYIILEAPALLQNRLGLASAMNFHRDAMRFQIHWITSEDHRQAIDLWEERGMRQPSLVDCASFIVMRRYGVTHVLAFDADFQREGFILWTGATI